MGHSKAINSLSRRSRLRRVSTLHFKTMSPGSLKRLASTDKDISPPPKRKVAATTTSKAVANFFKPISDKAREPEKIRFEILHDSVLVARYHHLSDDSRAGSVFQAKPVKVAAFDLDDTITTTASGNKFARNAQDWRWWHACVPGRLKQLHESGYAIVVMSNQAAVSLRPDPKTLKGDMRSLNNLKGKIRAMLLQMELPMVVYAATAHDSHRKPRSGMWELMLHANGLSEADVDHERSNFVGDAAGRNGNGINGKKDHSCSDRDFAANVGIPFQTPEEFFLGEAAKHFVRPFEPGAYLEAKVTTATDTSPVLFTKKNEVDIVLFCGSPGAGKSTFYWRQMQPLGYERVNQDILKTRERCMKIAMQLIEERTGVVVDNTNPDMETRASWIGLGKQLQVPVRLVSFTAPMKLCEHNDTVRALARESVRRDGSRLGNGGRLANASPQTMNPEHRSMLPKMAFTGFAARYREPRVEEGFEDITKVDFKVSQECREEMSGTRKGNKPAHASCHSSTAPRKPCRFGRGTGSRESAKCLPKHPAEMAVASGLAGGIRLLAKGCREEMHGRYPRFGLI